MQIQELRILYSMKILYLAHRIPYPPNKGDKIRSYNEIRYLSGNHQIDLACLADNPADMLYQADLAKLCRRVFVVTLRKKEAIVRGSLGFVAGKPLSVGYFYSKKIQNIVDQWLSEEKYDAVICFSSQMAEYILQSTVAKLHGLKPVIGSGGGSKTSLRLIMDFCDVDSDKWGQYAKISSFPKSSIYSLENRRLAGYERNVAEHFHSLVFISEREAEIFTSLNPGFDNICIIPNGVDHDYFNPDLSFPSPFKPHEERKPSQDAAPILLFTGAMDYHANVDGVTWFCREVMPAIKSRIPSIQFYIVGSNPRPEVAKLQESDPCVRVTGFVEDIRPYYQHADICVIPLRLARGVQNKVLEAMSMGKAVVTTSKAIEGIRVTIDDHVLVEDTGEGFARSCSSLLGNLALRKIMGCRARELVKLNYGWPTNMSLLQNLLASR